MTEYCVSKAGLEMLVMNAADELGPMNIRVNSVRPGLVPTELSSGLTASEAIVRDYKTQMPISRLGTTDDIASAIRYLAGDESGWVTGVNLSVDGGHHLRRGPWLDAQ
jgi:NAD(P)-dependent dehydrogenase (short-subunit alcohol dehydrogenase family)